VHLLEGENLCKNFGGLAAVSEVDFYVDQGEILGLLQQGWRWVKGHTGNRATTPTEKGGPGASA
jgi:ABC-type phosphonate transport system ATPase subunit